MKPSIAGNHIEPHRILALAYVLAVAIFFAGLQPMPHFETPVPEDISALDHHAEIDSGKVPAYAPASVPYTPSDLDTPPRSGAAADATRFIWINRRADQTATLQYQHCRKAFLNLKPSLLRRLITPPQRGGAFSWPA